MLKFPLFPTQSFMRFIKVFGPFLFFWLILNLFQAYFTPIHYDEAYYWLYSTKLSLGYFDHPPAVALVARMGDMILHQPIGLRLFFVLLGTASLGGILYLIDDYRNKWLTFIFIIAFPLVTTHIGGFMALPDVPLIFFFVLYLVAYKRYLKSERLLNILLLASTIVLMLYSKYHGFIIIFLTLLSNIKLLKKKTFWMVAGLSILLFLPHLIWQYKHDFPSFLYHLVDRSRGGSIFKNISEYIGGQIALAGPFAGLIIIWLGAKFRPKDDFQNALKYIGIGGLLFFLGVGFFAKTEAHWSAITTVALIIISYWEMHKRPNIKRYIPYLIIPAIVLLFIARLVVVNSSFTDVTGRKTDFHNWDDWVVELDSVAQGYPVLFTDRYRSDSRYSYAKNKYIPSAPHYNDRFSQIDLNRIDSIYHGKKVFAFDYGDSIQWKSKNTRSYHGSFIESYYSYTGIELEDIQLKKEEDSIFLEAVLINKSSRDLILAKDSLQKLYFNYTLEDQYFKYPMNMLVQDQQISSKGTIPFRIAIKPYANENKLKLNVGLSSDVLRVKQLRTKKYKVN